jgi:GNAT superfamily N-acetyltransferase
VKSNTALHSFIFSRMATSEYMIIQGLPSPQVYHDLRKLANLTPPPAAAMDEVVPNSLQNSFACFVAYERKHMVDDNTPGTGQEAVGMGRLIGDGLFLMLVDVAVHPDHQRKRIGQGIMKSLVDYADKHAPHAYTSLVADPMGQGLYPRYGFEDVQPAIGMYRCHRLQNDREGMEAQEKKYMEAMNKTSP